MPIEFSDDVDPAHREPDAASGGIEIVLTVDEQRKLVEAETGEPCFRMWLTKDERERVDFADWTSYELSDGRIAVWRKSSELAAIMEKDLSLWRAISERTLDDSAV